MPEDTTTGLPSLPEYENPPINEIVCGMLFAPQNDIIPIFGNPPWVQLALTSIKDIANLPPNWDGYGSPPLSQKAYQYAVAILKSLTGDDLPQPSIVPISGGGMQFEWRHKGRELELEIDPESDEMVYLKVHEDFTMEEDAYPVLDIPQTYKRIRWLTSG